MPSPRFWKMCLSALNGAWPTQVTPSPPMWLISEVRRSGIQIAMPWQPMPAMRAAAFRHAVDVLCGQPEQKNGVRATLARRRGQKLLLGFEAGQPLLELGDSPRVLHQPVGDHHGDAGRRQLAFARQDDAAGLVGLADDQRPAVGRRVVEDADELVLEVGALLLDDDHFLQALGEAPRAFRLERPGHADLVEADAERLARAPRSMPRSSSAWRVSR